MLKRFRIVRAEEKKAAQDDWDMLMGQSDSPPKSKRKQPTIEEDEPNSKTKVATIDEDKPNSKRKQLTSDEEEPKSRKSSPRKNDEPKSKKSSTDSDRDSRSREDSGEESLERKLVVESRESEIPKTKKEAISLPRNPRSWSPEEVRGSIYSLRSVHRASYTLSEAWSGVNWADLMAAQGAFVTDF